MPKYIDAEKLTAELSAGCMPIRERGLSGIPEDLSCIRDYIDSAPSEDVAPVRRGEWLVSGECYECSECGGGSNVNTNPYCWKCGAQMDGKGRK